MDEKGSEKDWQSNNGSPIFHEERQESVGRGMGAGRKMSAAQMAAETARRQSVAVNIVENPLKVIALCLSLMAVG